MAEPQPVPTPHGHPASMTPPGSADGEKPSSPPYQEPHHPPQQHAQHPEQQLTSPQLSDLDLDANAGSSPSKTEQDQPHEQDTDHEHGQDRIKQEEPEQEVPDEDIYPDHYYGGGKIPVFRPTMDQFRDFQFFVRKVDKYGMQSGVIKVIPPQEWLDSLPDLEDPVKSIRVKNPIMQEFHGSHGTYTQANIEKQRSYNLPQWKGVCDEPSHQPPARRGERRRNIERPPRGAKARSESEKRKPEPAKAKQDKTNEDTATDNSKPEGPPTPVSPQTKPVEAKSEELSDGESLPSTKPKGRQPKSVAARRKYNRGTAAEYIDEEAFKGFDYRLSDPNEFTAERCEELETTYWKSLMYNNPMYAADMPGSLFNDNVTSWNVAKLPNLLDVLGSKVPGVNTAYLYLGMWKATFAWHLEDVDLYSINYIHFGAPKQWYSISQEDLPRFEAAMKQMWPADAKHCNQFLRHKTYLVSPTLLKSQFGITVNKMVHYEREFVITFPYGYHSGYNLGYNCAESVNFATDKWLDYGRVAKKCNCESDSVWIDIAEIERKLRGESTPEYDEDDLGSDDQLDGASDILTPPRSVPEKSATRVKKRKQEGKESRAKRMKLHMEGPRKIPCVLCPNNLDYEDLLPTEDGKSHAHRRCALYIEETSILKDDSEREVVCDIDKIPKARMGLKCLFCREIRGACFQCMHGKCARSYHATCALLAGVQVEFGELAVSADDGCEYAVPGVDLKCKYHRPKKYSPGPSESWNMDPKIVEMIAKHKTGDLVQFQADKEINGAVVLENRQHERVMLLKVLPRGDVIELPYQWILVVKKSNFLPLPAGIKPLPAHLARKADSKDLASSLPSHGSPFADPNSMHQWAEFSCAKPPLNPDTVTPDLFKSAGLWHYLGKTSTECRAQYTDDPSRPVHNPRSNFLDSIKSLRAPHPPPPQPQPPTVSVSPAHERTHATPPTAAAPTPGTWRPPTTSRPQPPMQPSAQPVGRPVHPPQPPSQSSTQSSFQQSIQSPTQSSSSSVQPPTQAAAPPTSQPTTHTTSQQPPTTSQPSIQPSGNKQAVNSKLAVWNLGDRSAQLGMARRLVASITDHANHCAGYTIVDPAFTVQTLLGPSGTEPPKNGLEKLKKAMSESKVQAKSSNGFLPLRPLNMEADEVDHLLRMLRFAVQNLTNKHDPLPMKPVEKTKPEPPKLPRDPFPNPMGWAYLEMQKRHTTPVYRSPYAPGFGFTEYAKQEYGLSDVLRPARKESLSADFFAKLSPEDQEKVIQACGNAAPSFKKEGMGMDDPVDPAMELGDAQVRMDNLTAHQPATTTAAPTSGAGIDAMHTYDHHLSVFDMTLRADSPASSFTRMQFQYQSPQDFSSHIEHESSILPKHMNEHHDLFGDQQANQRFWGRSAPWTSTGGESSGTGGAFAYDEEHRPFFGPHLKPGHDYPYAGSDMDIERGPASLHSMDMAGFGFDAADDVASP